MNSSLRYGSLTPLVRFFDKIVVINLPERRDRRREMKQQLDGIGIDTADVEFFPAIRPERLDDWPSIGARGCFLSHYNVVKQARDQGLHNMLILEDDCEFNPLLPGFQEEMTRSLATERWHMVHLGHVIPTGGEQEPRLVRGPAGIQTTHCYGLNYGVFDRLVEYLEAVAQRPDGHPLGGHQHYDGALSMFREQNPDIVSLIAVPSLVSQRSSRSDVSPQWFDTVRGLRTAARMWRRRRRRIRH